MVNSVLTFAYMLGIFLLATLIDTGPVPSRRGVAVQANAQVVIIVPARLSLDVSGEPVLETPRLLHRFKSGKIIVLE